MFFKNEVTPKNQSKTIADIAPIFTLFNDGFGLGRLSFRLSNVFINLSILHSWILWNLPTVTARYCGDYHLNDLQWNEHSYGFSSADANTHYKISYYQSDLYRPFSARPPEEVAQLFSLKPIIQDISQCDVYPLPLREKDYQAMSSVRLGTMGKSDSYFYKHPCEIALDRGVFQPILETTEQCILDLMRQAHETCHEMLNNIMPTLNKLCEQETAENARVENEYYQESYGISWDALKFIMQCVFALVIGYLILSYLLRPLTAAEQFEKDYKPDSSPSFEARLEEIDFDFNTLPDKFIDNISFTVINDPVKLNKRFVYDAMPLLAWWKSSGNRTIPVSQEDIVLVEPDVELKNEIEGYVTKTIEEHRVGLGL